MAVMAPVLGLRSIGTVEAYMAGTESKVDVASGVGLPICLDNP